MFLLNVVYMWGAVPTCTPSAPTQTRVSVFRTRGAKSGEEAGRTGDITSWACPCWHT